MTCARLRIACFESGDRAVVEVGGGLRDVGELRDFEEVVLGLVVRDLEAAAVGALELHAVDLVAAELCAGVAFRAARRDEELEAFLGAVGQRVRALAEVVPWGLGCERSLERADRLAEVGSRDRVLGAGERGAEHLDELRVFLDACDERGFIGEAVHRRVEGGHHGLGLDRVEPRVPVLLVLPERVVDRGRVAPRLVPIVADGARLVVHAVVVEVVARLARDVPALRQVLRAEQLLPRAGPSPP